MMKATKYFLILLAVVALFAFACKADKAPDVPDPDEVEESIVDQWINDATAFAEKWEAKADAPTEELVPRGAEAAPLMEKIEEVMKEADEAQMEKIQALVERIGKFMEEQD
ncbi:MAG: hypothetical protein GX294_08765 [Candidatus Cloacimonetes bacterium]|nr:hypothetical protein [Candidatus Cloacimonadota bacterium]